MLATSCQHSRKGTSKSNSIPIGAADVLANASPDDQLLILKEISTLKGFFRA